MPAQTRSLDRFKLTGSIVAITGGGGLLGRQHAAAVAEAGGTPVLLDVDGHRASTAAADIAKEFGAHASAVDCDVTNADSVRAAFDEVRRRHGGLNALINNAARDPKVGASASTTGPHWSRFEAFSLEEWNKDLEVGVTGAFLCSQCAGRLMLEKGRGGVILNIASDLALIAPDQRIYAKPGAPASDQPVKPVSYSVVKAGLVGLTRYLSTYWASAGIRVNALAPGGVYQGQDEQFVKRLANLIPMGRMAQVDEYRCAVLFLLSEASSFMTGSVLVVDGGRTAW